MVFFHVIGFSFKCIDYGLSKINLLEFLRSAEPSGTEHINFHEPVADNVQTHEKHSVLNQLGSHDFCQS